MLEEYPVLVKSESEKRLFVMVSGEFLEISVFLAELWKENSGFALFFDKSAGVVRVLTPAT